MAAILTVGQAAMRRLDECQRAVADAFFLAVRTVYQAESKPQGRPEAIGSCFLLELNGRKFVVTAAHVYDYSRGPSAAKLYVAGESALVEIGGTFHVTEPPPGASRRADRYDFAFHRLSEQEIQALGKVKYIDAAREVSENRGTMSGRTFLAMGYPASRNKVNKIDPARTHVRARIWNYSGTLHTGQATADAVGVSEETHLLLKHNHKFSRTFSGDLTRSVKPQGASGGVLVDLGLIQASNLAPDAPCSGRLAGVLIEKNKKSHAIVAVKIGIVLDAIERTPQR